MCTLISPVEPEGSAAAAAGFVCHATTQCRQSIGQATTAPASVAAYSHRPATASCATGPSETPSAPPAGVGRRYLVPPPNRVAGEQSLGAAARAPTNIWTAPSESAHAIRVLVNGTLPLPPWLGAVAVWPPVGTDVASVGCLCAASASARNAPAASSTPGRSKLFNSSVPF